MEPEYGVTIDWVTPGALPVAASCRACGLPGEKPVLLRADATLPHQEPLHLRFLGCPGCGCAFVEGVVSYDYGGLPTTALGVATYAEAGAGLWPIVRTLAQLALPPGATLLEIGCGLGFGLDFAIRAQGWRARGIDPSTMAQAGRELLGLPIEHRYFGSLPEDSAGVDGQPADCILASEVIEHIEDPRAFVAMLRRALAPEGVLVLTTPDRALLQPDAPALQVVPLLSVGAHLVLFTAGGLEALLRNAGFGHVEVAANGAQLVAYASAATLRLERDDAVLRGAYRAYLAGRAADEPAGSMLWWAFAARAYQEAVVDSDLVATDRHWRALRIACVQRFGFDPELPANVPEVAGRDLTTLAARRPKALPTLLYARALDGLRRGATLGEVAGWMSAAAWTAGELNAALLRLGAVDLAALSAARASLAALAALAAERASADCLEALACAVEADPAAALPLVRTSFVGLVNAGDHVRAAELCRRWDIGTAELDAWPPDQVMPAGARDALFCLAMTDLAEPGREEVAMRRFALVRRVSRASATGLPGVWWAALRGECIAADRIGRHDHGTELLRDAPEDGMPADLRLRLPEIVR